MVDRGENAENQHFLLKPCFLPFINFHFLNCIYFCHLPVFYNFEKSKILWVGKELMLYPTVLSFNKTVGEWF